MTVELLVIKENGAEVAGKIHLIDSTVTAESMEGYKTLVESVLAALNFVDGGKRSVSLQKEPKAWFEALPATYNGSHLRAQLTK